ncbi:putative HNH endonuclease [Synechococcus phage ACG-2014f]|uniref:Putative HNH endonuclease n=2 Tax=Atlauavirus tusconc8 TaxID=2734085 RepID=A0A0E3HJ52_9CAUD|nr:HNH endonuclease [Synechococcus phage ACG-2014f_Syn7803C8]AIX31403.1 putative HNH endonuclease [Synechococcus phage ACG-2014f]AIX21384.1 putative HNH endonuclease [Synechococcus phage ACG-2014f_Syn7803C8]AIX33043.1 putative HNH endonuclease [Synechococcus phage ACG-2014f]AIX42847.1 putative HNH endonuclease [Synechococcus phage ACG-2014f]AIX43124.1 putative HNH endonuclease [Synechococcus phage ACG-2014f]
MTRDWTGYKNGKLTTLYQDGRHPKRNERMWMCECECGKRKRVAQSKLKQTKSCGCNRGPNSNPNGNNNHPLYTTWYGMKTRCLNQNTGNYMRYGGRGITICEEWRDNFQAFVDYVGERPEGHTLDRINNDGNYEPGNVRWATSQQQALNRRNNIH